MGEPYNDDDYRFIAERRLTRWEQDRAAAMQYVADQSKWVVGQLFVANGGALVALASSDALRPRLFDAGGWFVGGLVLAGLCGLATWAHAQVIVDILDDFADPAFVVDPAKWPKDSKKRDRAQAVFYGAILIGVLSVSAFAVGAFNVAAA